jgi:hypothetical protein
MRKFEEDAIRGMVVPDSSRGEALRSLVKFAIGQGYYDSWNNPSDKGVRSCVSREFPTDRGEVSR